MLRKSICLAVVLIMMFSLTVLAADYNEAPMLKEKVASGELPPVEERLPAEPMVMELKDYQEIGVYGGTWRSAGTNNSGVESLLNMYSEYLVEWDPTWQKVVPNLAKDWDVSDDNKVFTLYLREDIKWSDGDPFDSADILFWYKDVILNDAISETIGVPGWLKNTDKSICKVEAPDKYTVKFIFDDPQGLFMERLATPWNNMTYYPEHYAKQFHIDYADKDELAAKVEEAGFDEWHELFNDQVGTWQWDFKNYVPTLAPWEITIGADQMQGRVVAERNPYYWKVDVEGNQLPYIDRYECTLAESKDIINMMAIAGDLDYQSDKLTIDNLPIFLQNQEKENYRLVDLKSSRATEMVIYFNLNHEDPVKNELYNMAQFRKALSVAINRQEIIDLIFFGQTEACQSVPGPDTPYYSEAAYKGYTEFDKDKANEMLDDIGLTERDSEGFRLDPNGDKLTLVIEACDLHNWVSELELVGTYWQEVGLRTKIKVIDRQLWQERKYASLHDITVWNGGPGKDVIFGTGVLAPMNAKSTMAPKWGEWNEKNGESGIEPPAAIKRAQELMTLVGQTANSETRKGYIMEALEIHAENLWTIGICSPPKTFAVAKNNFHNVPDSFPTAWKYGDPAPLCPEQFYMTSE